MSNIKFIDRAMELSKIREMDKGNFFLVVKGRRRIGKTTLLRIALPEAVNIFVWPDKSLDWMMPRICKEHNLPELKNFSDAVEYILDSGKTVIIDEFQNFLSVDKSVYGEIQKMVDERKLGGKPVKIAVAGSSYSLMNKVFNDTAAPLYGRRTHEMTIGNLPIRELFCEMKMPIKEFIKTWAVFEGVPYYYEILDKKQPAEKNIFRLVLSKGAQLQGEGGLLLSAEFGRESKTYGTVLTAIAEGKTKLNEIASLFGNRKNEAIKYIGTLRKDFRFVRKNTPITAKPEKSREGRYEIMDNFLSFWFCFMENKRDYIEQERFEELEKFFTENFGGFMGKKFEKFVVQLIKDKMLLKEFPKTKIGRQWGKTGGEKGKNEYEIDIAALNEENKEALFAECKWKEKVNTLAIAKRLSEKAKHVEWHNNERKESYAIFAKSFAKKITEFDGKKVHCIDLKDMEKALAKN